LFHFHNFLKKIFVQFLMMIISSDFSSMTIDTAISKPSLHFRKRKQSRIDLLKSDQKYFFTH